MKQQSPFSRSRVVSAHWLVRIGALVQRMALMVMKPDDLVEFSRRYYRQPSAVTSWADRSLVAGGLFRAEQDLLKQVPFTSGRVLVLGVGGGREAIELAQREFEVTGVDFSPEMVGQARRNAEEKRLHITLKVSEISQFRSTAQSFEVVWLSAGMYSCIPTRKRRIELLKRIEHWLTPGGHFVCQYLFNPSASLPSRLGTAGKLFAYLTLGNLSYEPGDALLANKEFMHFFSSRGELQSEFEETDLEIVTLSCELDDPIGGAVLRKRANPQ